eukprot:3686752-Prymnesium_polylepis.1
MASAGVRSHVRSGSFVGLSRSSSCVRHTTGSTCTGTRHTNMAHVRGRANDTSGTHTHAISQH